MCATSARAERSHPPRVPLLPRTPSSPQPSGVPCPPTPPVYNPLSAPKQPSIPIAPFEPNAPPQPCQPNVITWKNYIVLGLQWKYIYVWVMVRDMLKFTKKSTKNMHWKCMNKMSIWMLWNLKKYIILNYPNKTNKALKFEMNKSCFIILLFSYLQKILPLWSLL